MVLYSHTQLRTKGRYQELSSNFSALYSFQNLGYMCVWQGIIVDKVIMLVLPLQFGFVRGRSSLQQLLLTACNRNP